MGGSLSNCLKALCCPQNADYASPTVSPAFSSSRRSSPHLLPLPLGELQENRMVVNTGSINADAFKVFLQDNDGIGCFRRWLLQTYAYERHIDIFLNNDTFLQSLVEGTFVEEQPLWGYATQLYATFIRSSNADATLFTRTPSITSRTMRKNVLSPGACEFMERLIQAKEPMIEMMALTCLKPFMQNSIFSGNLLLNQEHAETDSDKQAPNAFELLKISVDEYAAEDEQYWLMKLQNIAERLPVCISIANMDIAGLPIIYVNGQFTEMTGYSLIECVGRSSNFLQGPKSEKEVIQTIRKAFKLHQRIKVQITNYKKNGQEFVNLLTLKPIVDREERLHYYVAVHFDLSSFSDTDDLVKEFVYTHPIIAFLPGCIY